MGLPVLATRVPGCTDAVREGVTGTLVPAADAPALADGLRAYLRDPSLRQAHGEAGRARVLRDFRREDIWAAIHGEYVRLAGAPADGGGA
jgi:glycosyltransferase involved in cell wall biosynthesis